MRRVSWCLLFLSVAFGCRPGGVTEQAAEPLRVRLLYQHTLIGLDPHSQNDGVTGAVLSGLFQPLVEVLPGARVEPVLAESWTTPTPEVWRFRIREGVLFHSGRELTPEDVVFSLNRARRPESKGLSNYLNGIESVRVAPDGWVEIRTRGPFPLLAARLGMVGIVPQNYDPAIPVGTGPFCWVSGDAQGPLVFRKWEKFWAEKPEVEEIEIFFSSGDLESWELIRDGKVDVVGKTSLDFLMEHPLDDFPGRWTVIRNPASTTTILGLNLRSRPLDDPRVRLAIDLSIDREELVEKALSEGQGETRRLAGARGGLRRIAHTPELSFGSAAGPAADQGSRSSTGKSAGDFPCPGLDADSGDHQCPARTAGFQCPAGGPALRCVLPEAWGRGAAGLYFRLEFRPWRRCGFS